MEARYTIVDSPLGRVLIAATEKGISWLGLGEPDRALLAEFRDDCEGAKPVRDDDRLRAQAQAIVDYLSGKTPFPGDLPLDVSGTPFQRRVWDQLRVIPAGETRSYEEIARRIGRPQAARAVGIAIGANPVSILIPCHRAVRKGGALGGYRWGLECKRRLLEMEGAPISARAVRSPRARPRAA
jgi:AraC family transcriptional regulator, regulatory protein of adaptative response / methylated-DNA-[protein]-cysteine methyltransferase